MKVKCFNIDIKQIFLKLTFGDTLDQIDKYIDFGWEYLKSNFEIGRREDFWR